MDFLQNIMDCSKIIPCNGDCFKNDVHVLPDLRNNRSDSQVSQIYWWLVLISYPKVIILIEICLEIGVLEKYTFFYKYTISETFHKKFKSSIIQFSKIWNPYLLSKYIP